MDLARDTPVRLVPYPFARLNGALLLEVSDKEALVCLRRGARPQVLAELRRVLDVVDGAPKRLAISVRQTDSADQSRQDLKVSGRVGTGPDDVQARIEAERSGRSAGNTQTVQVVEGNAAYIRIGTAVPIRSRQTTVGPGGVRVQTDTIEYRDLDTGFVQLASVCFPFVAEDVVLGDLDKRRR